MEEKKDRRKTGLLLSILGVISLVLITAGVTYAFFSYAKEGQTENTISTGTIRFAYDETDPQGDGILLENALPMTDAAGMALSEDTNNGGDENNAFKFAVTSVTPSTARIPYVVTVKKMNTSTLSDASIKLYLVATGSETGNGTTLVSNAVQTFNQLPDLTTNTITNDIANENERILFVGNVPASSNGADSYTTNFVLRMWLSGEAGANGAVDYSPYEFMRTAVVTDNNPISAEAKITSGDFIKSTDYYALPTTAGCSDGVSADEAACDLVQGATWSDHGRSEYERIAYVKSADKTVLTRSQAVALNYASVDGLGNYTFGDQSASGFTTTEQYYQLDGQSYTVKVNVYAEGAKVTN